MDYAATATTNNNILPLQEDFDFTNWPDGLAGQVSGLVTQMVEQQLNLCTWFRIDCCSIEDAAVKLGVASCTVREWIKDGRLPASKPTREYLIRLVDIDRLLIRTATVVPMHDKRFKKNKK